MRHLLAGCGSRRDRQIGGDWDGELITLDRNPAHHPDVVWDLESYPWPFPDGHFDTAHFYDVLEHLGQQGDAVSFFALFSEIWRVLVPGGLLCATVPAPDSRWVWGDPSHRRYIGPESLVFLSQAEYATQVGVTPMSDFRDIYHADLEVVQGRIVGERYAFILRALK